MKTSEIYRWKEQELAIEIAKGEIASFRKKNIEKAVTRLNGPDGLKQASKVGSASDADLLSAVEKAPVIGPPLTYELPGSRPGSSKEHFESVAFGKDLFESFTQEVEEGLRYLKRVAPGFLYSGKAVAFDHAESIQNSQGLSLSSRVQGKDIGMMFKQQGSASIADGFFLAKALRGSPFQEMVRRQEPFLKAYSRLLPWKESRQVPVMIEPHVLWDKLLLSTHADRYTNGTGIYSGKLGTALFNKVVSLSDVSVDVERGMFRPFDGEGFAKTGGEYKIIENGVFKNLISDFRNAKKLDLSPSGNSVRSFRGGLSLMHYGAALSRGARPYLEVLSGIPECVFVYLACGGNSTDEGDFSSPVQLAFLVKNGEVQGRLPQVTMKTNLSQAFGSHFIESSSDGLSPDSLNPMMFAEMQVIPI